MSLVLEKGMNWPTAVVLLGFFAMIGVCALALAWRYRAKD